MDTSALTLFISECEWGGRLVFPNKGYAQLLDGTLCVLREMIFSVCVCLCVFGCMCIGGRDACFSVSLIVHVFVSLCWCLVACVHVSLMCMCACVFVHVSVHVCVSLCDC